MKISYNLLRKMIDFDWPVDQLAEKLTMSGSEIEAIEHKGRDITGIMAARVLSAEKIKGSDKLSICSVHNGSDKIQAVCGAPNVAADQIILFAPTGSTIPGMTLQKTVIHGVESNGMILSEAELGFSDNGDEITVLPGDIKPGTPLASIVDYNDTVFELEITPNRPDCLSHLGIAREIQAMGGGRLVFPNTELNEISELASGAVKITIDDPIACPRYTGRVVRGVNIGPSPLWLKMTVYYLGMRPINNAVDITNYVMLELGHPLHAFDYDLFGKPEVVVRRAADGEVFITLDDARRTLNKGHLLITDGLSGVAIAGIMGGSRSEVGDKTSNILLESAYFDPVVIRRGSKALGLSTESSRRFERGADQNMADRANDRACKLIGEIAGGRILKGVVDAHLRPFEPVTIELRPSRANSFLGTEISAEKMRRILEGLDMKAELDGNISVEQPSFRPDLVREIDLIEELARIYGYDNIPPSFRPGGMLGASENRQRIIADRVRSYLVGYGGAEIFPLTLADSRLIREFDLDKNSIRLMNPISEEMAVMRPNLILTMLPIIRRNINFREKDLLMFELGDVYQPGVKGELPSQNTNLIIAMTGHESPVFWDGIRRAADIFSLKGILENLADYLGIEKPKLTPAPHFAFDHSRSFDVYSGQDRIGCLGGLSEKACSIADIKGDIYISEIDFEKLAALIPENPEFGELARFPSANRDIAIVVDEKVKSDDILSEIIKNGGGLVEDVWLFDMYRGKNIPAGMKSLAYGIKYRLNDRTLTDSEVDQAHNNIAGSLETKFSARLRA